MYVLLLKLALAYSIPDEQGPDHTPHERMKHRCKVWKYGIQWLMESGVWCEGVCGSGEGEQRSCCGDEK